MKCQMGIGKHKTKSKLKTAEEQEVGETKKGKERKGSKHQINTIFLLVIYPSIVGW